MVNPIKIFKSPINRNNTCLIDNTESTLELFTNENGTYTIEWDIPELEETEHICIFVEEKTKIICDYDGIFEVPEQIIEFLRDEGFNVDYLTD